MTKDKLNLKGLIEKCVAALRTVRRYSYFIFLVFVALLYGFVMFRISSLGSEQPSSATVSSQVQAAQVPHIDKSVVKQLQSLQDNSVSVQSLFNQARSNPFQ